VTMKSVEIAPSADIVCRATGMASCRKPAVAVTMRTRRRGTLSEPPESGGLPGEDDDEQPETNTTARTASAVRMRVAYVRPRRQALSAEPIESESAND
jgi:hypothetical protein